MQQPKQLKSNYFFRLLHYLGADVPEAFLPNTTAEGRQGFISFSFIGYRRNSRLVGLPTSCRLMRNMCRVAAVRLCLWLCCQFPSVQANGGPWRATSQNPAEAGHGGCRRLARDRP